jgi:ankyrin repeat protein
MEHDPARKERRARRHLMTSRGSDFWSLLRAIAAGDDVKAKELLAKSPELALAIEKTGADRSSSTRYFLDEVKQYVYAGHTALHVAAAAYRADVARDLVERGADPGAANRRGATPLHCASDGLPGSTHWNPVAQAAVIEYLVRAGADPNATDMSGTTPLHRAVRSRCAAAVQTLLTLGAESRRKNDSGSTPLHLAVQTTGRGGSGSDAAHDGQARIIQLLIEHGARLTDTNARGKTVVESIRSPRVSELVGAL